MLKQKINEINEKIIHQSAYVEAMVEMTLFGLSKRNRADFTKLLTSEENKVNTLEVEIELGVTETLALFSPEANELRLLLMMLRMTNELERMGDLCVNIAESGMFLIERPPLVHMDEVIKMGHIVKDMLTLCVDAFLHGHVTDAKKVCETDNIIDEKNMMLIKALITDAQEDVLATERTFHMVRIAHNYERIGDLSTNIAEATIYVVEGNVIKHNK